MSRASMVESNVCSYLAKTEGKYPIGSTEYYARTALEMALHSFQSNNYGIGAVLVQVCDGMIKEYNGRNWMVTGSVKQRVFGHAETDAVMKFTDGISPDKVIDRNTNEYTRSLVVGLHCWGTLEACPMCAVVLTNAGAVESVSTVLDGELIEETDGFKHSDGGAASIGNKARTQPEVWQRIQIARGLYFKQLQTEDEELVRLSWDIFGETREEIDQHLAVR